jgi:hypothetical protein
MHGGNRRFDRCATLDRDDIPWRTPDVRRDEDLGAGITGTLKTTLYFRVVDDHAN